MGIKSSRLVLLAIIIGCVPFPSSAEMDPALQIRVALQLAQQYYAENDPPHALAVLEEVISRLGMQDSQDELVDIYYFMARLHSSSGNTGQALSCLSWALEYGFADLGDLTENPDFESIRREPAFHALLADLQVHHRIWESPAIGTPYRPSLSESEKIAGLSKLWAEVKYNFANFDLVPELDWDSLYVSYIPRVQRSRTTLEYYRLLQELCARLHDGHTGVVWPRELQREINGRVPLCTRRFGDSVVICAVYDDRLRSDGIHPGLEILSVDGVPALEYGSRCVQPYQLSNTPHGLNRDVYEYAYLRGPVGDKVTLELEDVDGQRFRRDIERVAKVPYDWHLVEYRLLERNVGYIAIKSFAWEEAIAEFDSAFTLAQHTDGLIIDLRENGGGDGRIGWTILGYLTDKPFDIISETTREYRPLQRAQHRKEIRHVEPANKWPADSSRFYTKPVVLLTRDRTGSMAENFCVGFRAMNRGTIVGGVTAGSSGTPLVFSLPGGGKGKVVTTRGVYPDGTEYIGRGVLPDIEVYLTLDDIRNGRDRILATALDHMLSLLDR